MAKRKPKCSEHPLAQLQDTERLAFTLAESQAHRGVDVTPHIAAELVKTIRRLEHDLAHARWGGLECDRPQ